MKKNLTRSSFALGLFALLFSSTTALSNGDETLGPPSIPVENGTQIVMAGTGMVEQPGEVVVNVPNGTTIKQVLLYWGGTNYHGSSGDSEVSVEGQTVTGELIGSAGTPGNTQFHFTAYRADITGLVQVGSGTNTLSIEDMDFSKGNDGAGIAVIIDDGSGATIKLKDGMDRAYAPNPSPGNTTEVQTFTFDPATIERTATLSMFFSSIEGVVSGGGTQRPSAIEITVDGVVEVLDNVLGSHDGDEWDTLIHPVTIPAGVSSLTVQALSVDNLQVRRQVASLNWITAGLSIPPGEDELGSGEGCTPGYWKQSQHFDSWPAPYTPETQLTAGTLFSDVFEGAFPDMTLLEVLRQGGGGLKALGRHTVAALLNARSDVSYDFSWMEVIQNFNSVYPGSKKEYEALKNEFAGLNEQGCPLN